jgi:hypothetical protein
MAISQEKKAGDERMRGPDLAVFIARWPGVPMEEALRKADDLGLVIASNKRLSQSLIGNHEWRSVKGAFGCWTGTIAAYDKPDQKLGKNIEYQDPDTGIRYVFPVPEEHIGKKNIALIAEHPNFSLEADGKTRVVRATEIDIITEFPVSNHWYIGDPKHDIPAGNIVTYQDPGALALHRIEKNVGMVNRLYDDRNGNDKRCIYLNSGPSWNFGVAVEATSGTTIWLMRDDEHKLIVVGSREQIAAAARLIEQMKVK